MYQTHYIRITMFPLLHIVQFCMHLFMEPELLKVTDSKSVVIKINFILGYMCKV